MTKPVATWHDKPLATFDLETNGVDPYTAKIVSFAFAVVNPDATIDHHLAAIVKPDGWTIPDEAAGVHGISTERALAEGILYSDALGLIHDAFYECVENSTPMVVYNAPYDLTIVNLALPSERRSVVDQVNVIDPLVIDKHWDRYRKGSRKLADTAQYLGVDLGDAAHDALADALAAERVARALHHRHRLIATDPAILHDQQRHWRYDQSASFEKYLRETKGEKDAKIPREWPRLPWPVLGSPA